MFRASGTELQELEVGLICYLFEMFVNDFDKSFEQLKVTQMAGLYFHENLPADWSEKRNVSHVKPMRVFVLRLVVILNRIDIKILVDPFQISLGLQRL